MSMLRYPGCGRDCAPTPSPLGYEPSAVWHATLRTGVVDWEVQREPAAAAQLRAIIRDGIRQP